jgi:hypothetical protein
MDVNQEKIIHPKSTKKIKLHENKSIKKFKKKKTLEETHKGKSQKTWHQKTRQTLKPGPPSFYQVARRCQKWAPNYFSIKKN